MQIDKWNDPWIVGARITELLRPMLLLETVFKLKILGKRKVLKGELLLIVRSAFSIGHTFPSPSFSVRAVRACSSWFTFSPTAPMKRMTEIFVDSPFFHVVNWFTTDSCFLLVEGSNVIYHWADMAHVNDVILLPPYNWTENWHALSRLKPRWHVLCAAMTMPINPFNSEILNVPDYSVILNVIKMIS